MQHKKEMKLWFFKRVYSENIINREMENVKLKKQVFNKRGGVTKVLPLVIMYHPLLIGDNVSFFTLVSGCYFEQTFIPATYG